MKEEGIEREATRFDLEARLCGVGVDLYLIGAVLPSTRPMRSGTSDWSSVCGRWARSEECAVVVVRLELGLRTGLSLLSLSLSLSLCAWVRKWFEVKILTETNFRVKAIKTHGQLKIISGKFIFHAQPNTHIYGKAFLEVIWNQNKHILNLYSDHSANFLNIPASINRGCLSKFSRLFHAFWPPLFLASLFFSILSYIKDVMEALALGISFCKQNILGFKELNIFFWIIKCPFTKKSTHASGS